MSQRLTLKNHQQEKKLFLRRLITLIVVVAVLSLILIIRLAFLQIYQHKFYSTRSRQNLLNIIPIAPKRGLIFDRNGVLLTKNIPTFSLEIIPDHVKNIKNTLNNLRKIIPISAQEIKEFNVSLKQHRPFQQVPLKMQLTEQQVARFYVNQYRFPGVMIGTRMIRQYPLGKSMATVLGYVGRINQRELNQLDPVNYRDTNYIGKTGIEKYDEKILHGKVGAEEVEIDASGHIVRVLKRIPPIPGQNLYLSIDSKLQQVAQKAFGNEEGAAVAIQPKTGEILAMVTNPSYNPNLFVAGISQKAYKKLLDSPNKPLYNRAIRGQYAPGSTIKPFFALAGLNQKVITPKTTIFDPGWFRLPNTKHIYRGWKLNGHGWVNVSKAIIVSCDIFFYNLATKLGISGLDHTLHEFGFGQNTGIDTDTELPGLVPTPNWKMGTKGHPWYTGDTVITGIGQGFLLTTPLQLASAVATLAEHGVRHRPHLLVQTSNGNGDVTTPQLPIEAPIKLNNPNDWNIVIHAMQGVITNPQGTGEHFGRNPGYSVAAKTGTAQVYSHSRNEERTEVNLPKRLRNNHLFISFAPVNNPQIALAVVVEHNAKAAMISRKIIDYYLKNEHHEKN